jgi:hypothetical protein
VKHHLRAPPSSHNFIFWLQFYTTSYRKSFEENLLWDLWVSLILRLIFSNFRFSLILTGSTCSKESHKALVMHQSVESHIPLYPGNSWAYYGHAGLHTCRITVIPPQCMTSLSKLNSDIVQDPGEASTLLTTCKWRNSPGVVLLSNMFNMFANAI